MAVVSVYITKLKIVLKVSNWKACYFKVNEQIFHFHSNRVTNTSLSPTLLIIKT